MKKNKDRLGKSLKAIFSDINSLYISNRYIKDIKKEEKVIPEINENQNESSVTQNSKGVEETGLIQFPFDLKKIGSILKEERNRKSFTIEEISNALNLRKPIIDAIENGLWERLPHEVYVRGYIKEYAHILKLDHVILPYLNIKRNKLEPAIVLDNNKKSFKKPLVFNKATSIFSKTGVLYTVVVLFIVVAFIFLTINKENKENERLEKAIQFSNNVQNTEIQQSQVLPIGKKLMITCHERTWISVIMDGKEKKEVILNPGEVIILNAKERFDILVGNAGGIKFLLNGKDVEFSGVSGQVKRITL
ncbi:MAG TPA: DUF4115 domain-containing protein [Syntrophorhabdaceae bacterium]|nr:DUF4115 domain-containing protein [Syntrophorhabdaceae bacterium]